MTLSHPLFTPFPHEDQRAHRAPITCATKKVHNRAQRILAEELAAFSTYPSQNSSALGETDDLATPGSSLCRLQSSSSLKKLRLVPIKNYLHAPC